MAFGNITPQTTNNELPRTAYETVGPEINTARKISEDAVADANTFIQQLLVFAADNAKIEPSNVTLDQVNVEASALNIPTAPVAPSLSINLPELPADFIPSNITPLDLNSIGALPTFNTQEPTVVIPGKPTPLTDTAPTNPPTITTEFNFPVDPDATLPEVPTLEKLDFVTINSVTLPQFTEITPTAVGISPPGITFSFIESPYSSTLLTAVQAELLSRLQDGNTGLSPVVEQAIFDRGRNREDLNSIRARDQILIEQAQTGFSRPSGSVLAAIDQTTQDTQNKIADLSREIMIKQADLEQQNIQFAIQTTVSLEQTLIGLHNNVQERAFQVQQFIQQTAIDIYNANIAKFNIQLEAYKASASVFEAQVRGELGKIEISKAEIEAEQLKNEINETSIRLYLARIQGVQTGVDVFKTQIDAINSKIQAETLKLGSFKQQIDIFTSLVGAKRDEFAAYTSEIEGEKSKVDIFDSQVKAFVSRIDAYAKQVDAQAKVKDVDISVEELKLRQYLGKLDAVVKNIQAETSAFNAQVDLFRGNTDVFTAVVSAEAAKQNVEIKQIENNIRVAQAQADIAVKNAEINIRNAQSIDNLLLQSLQSGAEVSSGLAKAALSGINIGASLQGSGSSSFIERHNFEE